MIVRMIQAVLADVGSGLAVAHRSPGPTFAAAALSAAAAAFQAFVPWHYFEHALRVGSVGSSLALARL